MVHITRQRHLFWGKGTGRRGPDRRPRKKTSKRSRYTTEQLIQSFHSACDEIGHQVTASEMRHPSGGLYTKRFGSWSNFLRSIGLSGKRPIPKTKFCDNCGEKFTVAPSHHKEGRRFCSSKCRSQGWFKDHPGQRKGDRDRRQRKRRYEKNRKLVYEYLLEHPCYDCGEKDPIVLEFDHVRDTKKSQVAKLIGGSTTGLFKEISKCEVRCANCHRRRHAKERGHYKAILGQRECKKSATQFE